MLDVYISVLTGSHLDNPGKREMINTVDSYYEAASKRDVEKGGE